jgi:hypothetical protein
MNCGFSPFVVVLVSRSARCKAEDEDSSTSKKFKSSNKTKKTSAMFNRSNFYIDVFGCKKARIWNGGHGTQRCKNSI